MGSGLADPARGAGEVMVPNPGRYFVPGEAAGLGRNERGRIRRPTGSWIRDGTPSAATHCCCGPLTYLRVTRRRGGPDLGFKGNNKHSTQHTAATLHAADKAAWWFRTPSGINPSQVIKSLHRHKAPLALPVSRCFTDLKARNEAKARRRRFPSNANPPLQIRMRRTRQPRLVSASASRPQVGCRVDKAMV